MTTMKKPVIDGRTHAITRDAQVPRSGAGGTRSGFAFKEIIEVEHIGKDGKIKE